VISDSLDLEVPCVTSAIGYCQASHSGQPKPEGEGEAGSTLKGRMAGVLREG
jgi:hypothetical protein